MDHLTDICRIGLFKHSGSEWASYSKSFTLSEKPHFAAIRLDSYGVCGIFINGEFLEAVTGRYANRVGNFACTSYLKEGENTVTLLLGNHYHQTTYRAIRDRAGAVFASVAAELIAEGDSGRTVVFTDETWNVSSDDGQTKPHNFSEVARAEYDRYWLSAALWEEKTVYTPPAAVLRVAGSAYETFLRRGENGWVRPVSVLYSTLDDPAEEQKTAVYDFGRLQVGYLELTYDVSAPCTVRITWDYTESPDDLENEIPHVALLAMEEPLKPEGHTLFILRRRAGRYLKLRFDGCTDVHLHDVRLRVSVKPCAPVGWFSCEDEILTRAWEVGRYTLLVNKHQEYESCPRHEMKFFSGDGVIEALTDYVTFGDTSLTDASLSLTEIATNLGIRFNRTDRQATLWDYPGWRIVTAWQQYRYTGDKAFVKKYFDELTVELEWMIDKTNRRGLVCQFPLYSPPMYTASGPVDYTSSPDRLGERTLLCAVFYKSLRCMSELARVIGDNRAEEWDRLAEQIKEAVNRDLWCEEKGAYLDLFYPDLIPQDGNALILLFGMAPPDRAEKVLETLKREHWTPYGSSIFNTDELLRDHARLHSPVSVFYEAQARFLLHDDADALELIRRLWGGMLKKGAGTFWEFVPDGPDERWRVPAHGWASGCTYLLSTFVLGVRPETPGWETVRIEPTDALDSFAGVVPTPRGAIAVRKEHGVCYAAVPAGVKVRTRRKDKCVLSFYRV